MSARLRLVKNTTPREREVERNPEISAAVRLRDLIARKPAAEKWLLDAHGAQVERVLFRILGHESGLEDLVQEVFVRVFARIETVRDAEALKGFITSVAVFVARETLRKKRRHGWLRFFATEDLPEPPSESPTEAREAVREFYAALDKLDLDERLAFTLRIVEGMELTEVASACGASLATIKRRLSRAEKSFVEQCGKSEVLSDWLLEGDRWT